MPLNILIVGAGVCGPALALMLQRSNPKHTITVVERFHELRTGGQQIDLKDQGIPITKKMGLLEPLRNLCVHESGMELVDDHGSSLIQFGVTAAGDKQSSMTLTNEFEFMRGDMVKLYYDTTIQDRKRIVANGEREGGLTYEFNKSLVALDQSSGKGVEVTFSDNTTRHFDLLVGADGQTSRTRRLTFGEDVSAESFKPLNIIAAYYHVPRVPEDDNLARIFFGTNSRMVMTRTGDRPFKQVYFFLLKDKERLAKMKEFQKQPISTQKDAWVEHYKDAGWECERFCEGLQKAEDFYAVEIAQIKMPEGQIHKGNVVLLGDAGYCPSPFTGQGTTLSLIGAYVLAGELAKHGDDVAAALEAYTSTMKTPIEQSQTLRLNTDRGIYPTSALGIKVVNNLLWTMSVFKLDKLLQWIGGFLPEEKGKWVIPEYPELNLEI